MSRSSMVILACALALPFGSGAPMHAQMEQGAAEAPAVLLVPAGDSVRLLLTRPAPAFGGFNVYRSTDDGAPVLVTSRPVVREHDPGMAGAIIGAELPAVLRMAGAQDAAALLQTLRTDDFTSHVLALAYPTVAQVMGRTFVDRGLRPGARYDYRVVFTDGAGRETDDAIIAAVTLAGAPLPAPTALAAEPVDGTLRLTWRFPAYAGDARDLVFGFNVYRAARGTALRRVNTLPVLRNDRSAPMFADSTVVSGVLYEYTVRAIDVARREGPPAAALSAALVDRAPPAPPTGVTAEAGDGRVHISWRASADPDVAAYIIERGTSLERAFDRLLPLPVPARTAGYTDSSTLGGTQYFYRVRSVDRAGNESRPGTVVAALPWDRTRPAPPSAPVARAEARTAQLTWTPSASPDVIGYYIYRGTNEDRLVRLVDRPVAARTYVDEGYARAGLTPGGSYVFAVTAVDAAYNESDRAIARLSVVDDAAPAAPTGLTLSAGGAGYVDIIWSASPASDVVGYRLYRTDMDSARALPVELTATAARTRSARDSTAVQGRLYRYDLFAVDVAGNRSDAATDTVRSGDRAAPPPPRHAAVSLSGAGGVLLSWERVAAPDLVGYHVYRSLLPTGRFERITASPLAALEFRDDDGAYAHWYSVRAVDRSGNESEPGRAVRGSRR